MAKEDFLTRKLMAVVLCLLALSGCAPAAAERVSGSRFLLDTYVSVTLYDSDDRAILDGALDLCAEYELVFSRTDSHSELYALNHAGEAEVAVSDDLYAVLEEAVLYSERTGGAYDVTIGPVSDLWDFKADMPRLPDEEALQEALALVDWRNIVLENGTVRLLGGAQVDLGSIAKGYIADRLADYLRAQGVNSAIINLGGNVLVVGERLDGNAFTVGVQRPFEQREETIGLVRVRDRSVVTSGIYERSFEVAGELYHHILDPATGWPVRGSLDAVTILSERSTDGDALSTAVFLLGEEQGMALVDSLEGVEAVFCTRDGRVLVSAGFASGAEVFEPEPGFEPVV